MYQALEGILHIICIHWCHDHVHWFTLSSETLSFGALASQGHAGFAGQAQQGSEFKFGAGGSAGTSFGTPAMYVGQSTRSTRV